MRKILTIVCLTLACGLLRAEVYTGNCGAESDPSNIQWRLDTETGWLEFTGSGLMKDDFYQSKAPWAAYNSSIQYVRLASGITSVGNYAFKGCYNLLSVDMPATVTRIGKEAFRDCYWSYFTNIQPIGGTPTGAATATACPAPLPAKTLRNGQLLIILPEQSTTYHISGIPCR